MTIKAKGCSAFCLSQAMFCPQSGQYIALTETVFETK